MHLREYSLILFYIISYCLSIVNIVKWYIYFEVTTMKPLKESVSITLDANVIEEIRALADEAARPFSQYINLVLRNHIRAVAKRREQQGSQEQE